MAASVKMVELAKERLKNIHISQAKIHEVREKIEEGLRLLRGVPDRPTAADETERLQVCLDTVREELRMLESEEAQRMRYLEYSTPIAERHLGQLVRSAKKTD